MWSSLVELAAFLCVAGLGCLLVFVNSNRDRPSTALRSSSDRRLEYGYIPGELLDELVFESANPLEEMEETIPEVKRVKTRLAAKTLIGRIERLRREVKMRVFEIEKHREQGAYRLASRPEEKDRLMLVPWNHFCDGFRERVTAVADERGYDLGVRRSEDSEDPFRQALEILLELPHQFTVRWERGDQDGLIDVQRRLDAALERARHRASELP